jgi:hypothetical protein
MRVKNPKTVDRALDELEKVGAIEVEYNQRVKALGQVANSYVVRSTPKGEGEQVSIPLDTDVEGGRDTNVEGPLDTDVEPKDKSSSTKSSRDSKHTSPAKQDDAIFEMTWSRYPPRNGKKLSKAKAAAVWNRLSDDDRAKARIAIANYAVACEGGLTIARDAHRWLRDRDFEDWLEPATPQRASPNGVKKDNFRGINEDWERVE